MTREEEIRILQTAFEILDRMVKWYYGTSHDFKIGENDIKALEVAKIAIEAMRTEHCDDCISRRAALECFEMTNTRPGAKHAIETLPSVQPEQKTGKWIKYGVPRCGEQHYQCTTCDWYVNFGVWGDVYTKQFKFCPNCGAKMDEPKESEDAE